MLNAKINSGDWVVICDGRKAMILENTGDWKFPNLKTIETRQQPDAPTREMGTDSPGRMHPSVGTARSSVEQTDWHDEAERTFLHGLLGRLDAAIRTKETKHLVVVAAPRALGMLRQAYTAGIRGAIIEELAKDLVHMPISDLEKRLFS